MTDKESIEALTPLERDVLLHSSGELPWTRRLFLGVRLRGSAKARRLRDDLRALSAAAVPAPGPAARWIPMAAASAAFATVVVALIAARHLRVPSAEPPAAESLSEGLLSDGLLSDGALSDEITAENLLMVSMQLDIVPSPAFSSLDGVAAEGDSVLPASSLLLPNLDSFNDLESW